MKRRPERSNQAGFTLIEILIALTLMVGVLAALASLTSQWLPNWNRGFARVQSAEALGRGLQRLMADLSAAEFIAANGKTQAPLFDGDELSVRLVRQAIGPNTQPGLEFVRVAMTADKQGPLLVRTRTPFRPLPTGAAITDISNFSDPVVLLRRYYRVLFAYAGPDRVWRNSWRNASQLPSAVRITVLDAASERRLAVSTVVPVHVGAPAFCVSAPNPTQCVFPPAKAQGDGL